MKLAKEKKEVDLIIKSDPWSEKDLADFRELMQKLKSRNNIKKSHKSRHIERILNKATVARKPVPK